MEIPKNIKKEHIEKAIEKIESEGIPQNAHSSTYDILFNENLYPPKLVISFANIFANGIELDRTTFKGGEGTKAFNLLKKEGFKIIKKIKPRQYWLYAPGEKASKWNEFYKLGIMGLGWDALGDLNNYSFKEEIVKELQRLENTTGSKKNDATANFDFKENISIGDIIIIKKGRSEYLGYGIVTSDYFYNNKRKDYKKCRKVNWLKKGVWNESEGKTVLKTLTNVTKYSDYIEKLISLIGIEVNIKEKFNQYLTHKVSRESTIKQYLAWMDKIQTWFIEKEVVDIDYNIWNDIDKIQEIQSLLDDENKYGWKAANKPIKNWMSSPWNAWVAFNENSEIKKIENIDMKFDIKKFSADCTTANLKYSNQLVTRYISSLVTKPFVLLSGLSGSGKTKLAQSFAQWICEDKSQYCIVPVGADWTNREPLLGYVNALDNNEYILPENGALQLLIRANENQDKPYFLILDEMNLSHVERYFADFLSVMESKDKFKLHSDAENEKSDVPHELTWPKNLFVVGTVNIDETTYMFSPKVLDRANAIEFRVTEKEIEAFLNTPNEIDLEQLEFKGANMGASFVEMAKNKEFEAVNTENLNKTLVKFFAELKKTGAEFGYRTGMEIHRLYNQLSTVNTDISENDKIDIAIMQKLLPKLHGSRRKLCPILEVLAKLCVAATVDAKKDFLESKEELIFKDNGDVLYPLSLEKITRMYKGAVDNGFASYAEA